MDDFGEVVSPDSDGKPMADNDAPRVIIRDVGRRFPGDVASRDDVYMSADLLWYPVEGQSRTSVAPDLLVVFGRPKGKRRSWRRWEEDDARPAVVLEILSHSNTPAEMSAEAADERAEAAEARADALAAQLRSLGVAPAD